METYSNNRHNVENIWLLYISHYIKKKILYHILDFLRVRDTGQFHQFLKAWSNKQIWFVAWIQQSQQVSQALWIIADCLYKWEQSKWYGLSAKLLQMAIFYQSTESTGCFLWKWTQLARVAYFLMGTFPNAGPVTIILNSCTVLCSE